MADAITYFAMSQGFAVAVLVGCAIIVVVEATLASRHALWGDFFSEDGDE